MKDDSFWTSDVSILFTSRRLVEFFPTADQTVSERLNAISRLIIYISAALAIYRSNHTPLVFGMFLLFMIHLLWTNKTKSPETFEDLLIPPAEVVEPPQQESGCVMPTAENPFMNFLLQDQPNRAAACKGPGVQEIAANLLNKQLFDDVDDLFDRNNNQRMFMTMPVTTNTPDTEKFRDWLMKSEPCKAKNQCWPYEDPRVQRQLIPEDLE
jgi:hypothetical protein